MQNTPKTIKERVEEITETVNNTKYVEAHLVVELLSEQDRISKESVKEKIERIKKERLTIPKSPLDITPREQMQRSVQPIYRGYKSNEESHNQALDLAINILEE